MKLSDLIAACAEFNGDDPVITIEGRDGMPVAADADCGVMRLADGSIATYVCLTPIEPED